MSVAVPIQKWPEYLLEWAGDRASAIDRPIAYRPIEISGEIITEAGVVRVNVGKARDAMGSLLHLTPSAHPFPQNTSLGDKHSWSRMWAKVAVQSGHLTPTLDPHMLVHLSQLRRAVGRV